MVYYYFIVELCILCLCVSLWMFCCHLAKKRREAEGRLHTPSPSPPLYIIPIYEEELEDVENMQGANEASYRGPPVYCSRYSSPPPPYMLEAPSYRDPPPSYTDPPAYSEQP